MVLYFLTFGGIAAVGGMMWVASEVLPRRRFKKSHAKHLKGLHQYDMDAPRD